MNMNKGNAQKDRWFFRIGAALLLIIALLITLHQFGVAFPWGSGTKGSDLIQPGDILCDINDNAAGGHLPGLTPEELRQRQEEEGDGQNLSCYINSAPVFANGKEPGNLEIENPEHNAFPVAVQIVLEKTGKVIYESGGLMPNQHIAWDKLQKPLKAGTYDAIAYINAYDPETKLWVGKSQRELIITVES